MFLSHPVVAKKKTRPITENKMSLTPTPLSSSSSPLLSQNMRLCGQKTQKPKNPLFIGNARVLFLCVCFFWCFSDVFLCMLMCLFFCLGFCVCVCFGIRWTALHWTTPPEGGSAEGLGEGDGENPEKVGLERRGNPQFRFFPLHVANFVFCFTLEVFSLAGSNRTSMGSICAFQSACDFRPSCLSTSVHSALAKFHLGQVFFVSHFDRQNVVTGFNMSIKIGVGASQRSQSVGVEAVSSILNSIDFRVSIASESWCRPESISSGPEEKNRKNKNKEDQKRETKTEKDQCNFGGREG